MVTMSRVTCTYEEAQNLARNRNEVIWFQTFNCYGDLIFHGTAHPCGCVRLNTILENETIGWGSWWEDLCGITECAEAIDTI